MVELVASQSFSFNDGINDISRNLSFYFIPVGDYVWVDGVANPSVIGGKRGIPFMGVKSYNKGAFIVGTNNSINHARGDILHVHTAAAESFTDRNAARAYFNRKRKELAA